MKLSTFCIRSLFGAAFISPALACVQFSLNFNLDNELINGALTDNGGQTCQITNEFFPIINNGYNTWVYFSCLPGYFAGIYLATGEVEYKYGSFDGTFGTVQTIYPDGRGSYWTANVWGC